MADAETEKIINEIRDYPELYLIGHPDYKNSYKKEVAWRKIERSTGLDVKSLKAKWKNLRDTYKKYKQSQLTFSGQGAKKYANWVWAEHMSFVDSTTNLRSTESTLNTCLPELQTPENVVTENLHLNPMDNSMEERVESIIRNEREQEAEDDGSLSNISETGSDLHRRRRRRSLDPADKIIDYLKTRKAAISSTPPNTGPNLVNVSCDRLDMTFLGFADSVKKLSSNNQAIIKLQITKLITEYELKEMISDNRPNSEISTYVSTSESITLFNDDLSNYSNISSPGVNTRNNNIQHTLSNMQSQIENRKIHHPSTSGANTQNMQHPLSNTQNQTDNRNIHHPSTSGVNTHTKSQHPLSNAQNQIDNRNIHHPSTSGPPVKHSLTNTQSQIENRFIILQSAEINDDERTSQIVIDDETNTQKYIIIQPSDHTNDDKENNYSSVQSYFAKWNKQ